MKKKTIVLFCFALLFLLSAFSGFADGLVSGGVGCLIICGILAFWGLRSAKQSDAEINRELPETSSSSTPPNKSSFPNSPQNNTIVNNASDVSTASPPPSNPTPLTTETITPPPYVNQAESEIDTTHSATVSDTPTVSEQQYEYLEIKVAGVTFKNDKGPTRQTLLRKIKERTAPFDEYLEISLNQYDFEGELAYSVCVNDRQIGNVPKSQVQYLYDNIERFVAITGINVYGGYRDENGYFKSYGAAITVKFRLSDAGSTPDTDPSKGSVLNSGVTSTTPVVSSDEYGCEYLNITLAGVTYQNDDGTDRQLLLRRLHFHDAPFDSNVDISVKECRFNDEIAFSVLANDLQLGFIPKSQIAYVSDNFDRIVEVTKIKVYGGGHDKSGNEISYGASITLKLRAN